MSAVCSICSTTLVAKILACGHSFHCPCIDQWTETNNSCPICRATFEPSSTRSSVPSDTLECYICLENINTSKTLICGHQFHESCVYPRLVEANKCPYCSMYCGIDEELDLLPCKFCDEPVMDCEATLPCGHTFHQPCVASWLLEKNTCPECLTPSDESSELNICSKFCKSFSEISAENEVVFVCDHKFHRSCSQDWYACPTCGGITQEKAQNDCMFCTLRITREETCLPCGHTFHESCVAPWQREQRMCPHCLRPCEPPASLDEARAVDTTESVLCLSCLGGILGDELVLPCGHKFHMLCFESWQGEQKKCPECLLPCEEEFFPIFPEDDISVATSPPVLPFMDALAVESTTPDTSNDSSSDDSGVIPTEDTASPRSQETPLEVVITPTSSSSVSTAGETASQQVDIAKNSSISEDSSANISTAGGTGSASRQDTPAAAAIADIGNNLSGANNASISDDTSANISTAGGTGLSSRQDTSPAAAIADIGNKLTNAKNTSIIKDLSVDISTAGGTSSSSRQDTPPAAATADIGNTLTDTKNASNVSVSQGLRVNNSTTGNTPPVNPTAESGNAPSLVPNCSQSAEIPDRVVTNSNTLCLVCSLEISDDEIVLPSGHALHKACVIGLLKK